jgi:DNA-binding MarR family transcriptional regulator
MIWYTEVMREEIENLIRTGDLSGITTYQAGIMQAHVARLLQHITDDILRPYGITKVQWQIVGATLDAGDNGVRITDLSQSLGTTLAFLTNTVNSLEQKNILQRVNNKNDNRSKLISVHPDFQPQCAVIENALREGLRTAIYAHVDVADFHTYIKVLFQLANVSTPAAKQPKDAS